MTREYIILTILFLTVFGYLFGQDTSTYRQANGSMFSNNYTFIKKNKSDNFGTFIQYSETDDMQYWYGQGVFTETNKKYFLTFDTTNNHNRIETVSSTEHSDTLYIKWLDWRCEQQEWFSIRFADTIKNTKIYRSDFLTGFVKIPKTDLKDKKLSLYAFGSGRNIFDFIIPDNIDEINLFVNDTVVMHTFDNTKITLKKNKRGFTTIGMWTKEKSAQFTNDFTEKWKADSMGTNGFREKSIAWDSTKKTYLINGINISRYKRNEILDLLGEPNFLGTSERDITIIGGLTWGWSYTRVRKTMNYTFRTCNINGHNSPDFIEIEFRNSKVVDVCVKNLCKLTER